MALWKDGGGNNPGCVRQRSRLRSCLCNPAIAISGTMPTPTISRVRPLAAERGRGVTLVEALFSDNRLVRFRVLSRDPAAVQAVGTGPLPEHERVVEAWLEAHGGRRVA
jgi:alpha-beta hydrolase superfamily lysophospholipase